MKHGGTKKTDETKKGFSPLFSMINNSSSKLSVLTVDSLKGFMIRLSVNSKDSVYKSLNKQNSRFTKPVTEYILKFVVITDKNDTHLPNYKDIEKSSESMDSFFDEAKLQQHIWSKSITGGRPPICPPVVNFSIFDNTNSTKLLNFLIQKSIKDYENSINYNKSRRDFVEEAEHKIKCELLPTTHVFTYLRDTVANSKDKSYKIGILTMPMVSNSKTLADAIQDVSTPPIAVPNVIAKIVRLFIEIGVIHFDLHSGNVLVFKDSNDDSTENDSLIIDFGRASDITNGKTDMFVSREDKQSLFESKKKFYDGFISTNSLNTDPLKKNFINDVIKYIAAEDHYENDRLFGYSNETSYQMDWIEQYIRNPAHSGIILKSYNILETISKTSDPKLLPSTIKKYETEGHIVKLDGDPSNFMATFPKLASPLSDKDVSDLGMCRVMGGGEYSNGGSTKRHQRQRKRRQTRRNYK